MNSYDIADEIVDLIKDRNYTIDELSKKLRLPVSVLINLLNIMAQAEIVIIKNDHVKLGRLGKIIANI